MFENQRFVITNLYVELTSSCNLRCRHCYNSSGSPGKELPIKLLKAAIRQAKEDGVRFISLSGGEPLLYGSIWELMDYLSDMDIFFLLITNGTLLERDVVQRLTKYRCNIQLSLDGPDSESHDTVRGKGNFDRAVSNIKKLHESGFEGNVVIKGVLTEYLTEQSIQKYRLLAEEVGAVKVEYGWLNRTGRGKDNYEDLFIGKDRIAEYIEILHKNQYKDDRLEISDIGYTDKCPLVSVEENPLEVSPKITYDGNVFPCQMFVDDEFALGNIYKQMLMECIQGERFLKLLELLSLRKEFMPACQRCVYKIHCSRGCPALGVNQGNLFACDEFCKARKMEFSDKLCRKASV